MRTPSWLAPQLAPRAVAAMRIVRISLATAIAAYLTLVSCAAALARPPAGLEHVHPFAPRSAWALPAGEVLLETGASFRRWSPESSWSQEHLQCGASALRMGLPAGLEVSAATGGWALRTLGPRSYRGLTDLEVALKGELLRDPEGARLSLLAGARLQTGSTAFRAERARPRLGVLSSSPMGQRGAFHATVIVERRPEAPPDGVIYGGGSIAADERPTRAVVLVERAIVEWEFAPQAAWSGYFEAHYRRDPDLANPESIGLGLGARSYVGDQFLADFAVGLSVSDPADAGTPELFAALGMGIRLGVR